MQLPDEEALGRVEVVREVEGQVVVSFPDFDEEEGGTIDRTVRVTVARVLPDGRYWSSYEEPIFVRGREGPRTVWAQAGFAPVSAETAEGCLRAAVELLARAPEPPGAEPPAAS
jgi:hypothetical protein